MAKPKVKIDLRITPGVFGAVADILNADFDILDTSSTEPADLYVTDKIELISSVRSSTPDCVVLFLSLSIPESMQTPDLVKAKGFASQDQRVLFCTATGFRDQVRRALGKIPRSRAETPADVDSSR